MAGYSFSTYKAALQTMIVSQAPDLPFDTILPSIIDYAEQRIYRELDLISTVQTDTSQVTVVGNRVVTIPNTFVVVNNINLFIPSGGGAIGTRKPLVPVSRDLLDVLWPDPNYTDTPENFSMTTQWEMALGPYPDGAYTVEVVGTYRPAALSSTNTVTFISERLPDLFMAASMVYSMGYQRNFGAMANDPQSGMSWEQQYQLLKASADAEELRKHFASSAWSSRPPSPVATPPRS